MTALEGSISDFIVRLSKEITPYGITATKEQFDELFNGCIIIQYPKEMKLDGYITFYRKSDPEHIMSADPICFYRNPNNLYRKDYFYATKHGLVVSKPREERVEELRSTKENALRESMLKEDCILTSKNETPTKKVHYTYDGLDYVITPINWYKGIRAHKMKYIHYTHEHIKQLFEKEGCKLIHTTDLYDK